MAASQSFAIDRSLPEIKDRFTRFKNLILSAPPGTGKTTRVPLFLLESGLLSKDKCLLLLQPRRVAAKQTALYMARLLQQKIGGDVGYIIRFESKIGSRTRIKVVTEAILNRMIEENPELPDVGMVVLDEFHERSIHTDLGLALLKEIQETLRPDLKILVMSATIDPGGIQNFLADCDFLEASAPQYPVEIKHYCSGLKPSSTGTEIADKVAEALFQEFSQRAPEGDTLIFLPGIGEIKRTLNRCSTLADQWHLQLCELHSQTSSKDQDSLFQPSAQKRLIFCTNIAETSITLENIKLVVDTGLQKEIFTDSSFGIERLLMTRISKQNATQRSGRAGRVAAGRSLRLWTRDEQLHLDESPTADIHRIDLKPVLLLLSSLGYAPFENFRWFEAPPAQHLKRDRMFLFETECVDEDGRILDLGRKVVRLGFIDPRVAVFFVQAILHGMKPEFAAAGACVLQNLEWFSKKTTSSNLSAGLATKKYDQSDFTHLISLTHSKETSSDPTLPEHFRILYDRLISNARTILAAPSDSAISAVKKNSTASGNPELIAGTRSIHSAPPDPTPDAADRSNESLLGPLLLSFYDRVCRRRGQTHDALMVGGRGLSLAASSECRRSPFFIALDPFEIRVKNSLSVTCTHAHGFELADLRKIFGSALETKKRQVTNSQLGRTQILESLFYKDLELTDPQPATLTREESHKLQLQNIFKDTKYFFSSRPKFEKFFRRIQFLYAASSKNFSPAVASLTDSALMDQLKEYSLSGIDFNEPEETLLAQLSALILSSKEFRILNEEAPHQIKVPSGSILPIEYFPLSENKAPQLDVRLQEIFGMLSSPLLGFGSTPLVINLLSPGYKSVQVTRDLKSFWNSTYYEIRRELKAQYPRHLWPENPESAQAQAKGGKKRGSNF